MEMVTIPESAFRKLSDAVDSLIEESEFNGCNSEAVRAAAAALLDAHRWALQA